MLPWKQADHSDPQRWEAAAKGYAMSGSTRGYLVCAGLAALALGNGNARTYQLKKILVIDETGQGGYANTAGISFTTDYYCSYLAPRYGFECAIPANQAALDSVMSDDSLKTYDVVVFNGGARIGGVGAVHDTSAQHAFERWLKAGGGAVGIHQFIDHDNTWPWLRDSVLNGATSTYWSPWGSDPDTKAQWDTLKTNGVLNSLKPEYDSIRACFPRTRFTYPDSWFSYAPDVRPHADVLMSIDESTYSLNTPDSPMGIGHPVMWAYHLPPDSLGSQGRFIYFARGKDKGAWDGTSSNRAPMTVGEGAIQQGDTVFSDTSHALMSKGWLWQSLQWAAGLRVPQAVHVQAYAGSAGGHVAEARRLNDVLNVTVQGKTGHEVRVFTIAGRIVAYRTGTGSARYSFPNLKHPCLYIIQVKSAQGTDILRVML